MKHDFCLIIALNEALTQQLQGGFTSNMDQYALVQLRTKFGAFIMI